MKILVVGAGFYGAICAYEYNRAGWDVTVIDRRPHIGGNAYTEFHSESGIHEHTYGAHIFHTNSQMIWDYLNKFTNFNNFVNRVKAISHGKIYSLPFNLMTFYEVYGVYTPSEAKRAIQGDLVIGGEISNLEDYCLSTVGRKIYELFIEGYSEKQWNRHPRNLPASLIKRLPLRFDFNDNYFNDKFQGIPTDGYTAIFDKLLTGIKVDLNVDFIESFDYFYQNYDKIIYTGPIDELLKYEFGELQYRSLRFEREILDVGDFQGNAVVNYCDKTVPFTRILEHRHFNPELISGKHQNVTVITKEYPEDWKRGGDAFYPLGDEQSLIAHKMYLNVISANYEKLHVGGRLGDYRYYDMHQVVGAALAHCKRSIAK